MSMCSFELTFGFLATGGNRADSEEISFVKTIRISAIVDELYEKMVQTIFMKKFRKDPPSSDITNLKYDGRTTKTSF